MSPPRFENSPTLGANGEVSPNERLDSPMLSPGANQFWMFSSGLGPCPPGPVPPVRVLRNLSPAPSTPPEVSVVPVPVPLLPCCGSKLPICGRLSCIGWSTDCPTRGMPIQDLGAADPPPGNGIVSKGVPNPPPSCRCGTRPPRLAGNKNGNADSPSEAKPSPCVTGLGGGGVERPS